MPGYDISMILFPTGGVNRGIDIFHNGMAEFEQIYPLVPYTCMYSYLKYLILDKYHNQLIFSGDWSTTCRIPTNTRFRHLSFMVNRKAAQASMRVETIYPIGQHPDTDNSNSHGAPKISTDSPLPTNKFLLGRFTILYVISGSIKVLVDGDPTTRYLKAGQTMVCEREDNSAPTDLCMIPISSSDHLNAGEDLSSVVLTIQITAFKSERLESPGVTPLLRPALLMGQKGRSGSFADFQLTDTQSFAPNHWESVHRYNPPVFAQRYENESDVPPPVVRDTLNIDEFPKGTISTAWINMVKEGLSEWIRIPVIIARGTESGVLFFITLGPVVIYF